MGGISSIIGGIALVGFLVFLAGVGLVVVSASQGRPVRGGILLGIIGLIIGVLGSVISQGIIVVAPQERAVVFETLTGNLLTPRGPGTHIIIPVLQEATIYPTNQQEYTMSGTAEEGNQRGNDAVEARTIDGQTVLLDITVLYAVDDRGEAVNTLHRRWLNTYQERFVRPTVRGLAREVVSGYRAADIYGVQRAAMEDEMQNDIAERMIDEGLILSDLLVRNIQFSPEFTASIERAQIAQQDAEQARLRVEQSRQEADQLRAQAQGERDAAIARAEGEAQSVVLNAQAQAESLRLVSEQLAANPLLIQYEYIRNLSDNVSLALVPSNSPFLFDFNSIENLPAPDEDFDAPELPEAEDLATPAPSTDDSSSDDSNSSGN